MKETKLPRELEERITEVKLDNVKPGAAKSKPTEEEVARDVNTINPDPNTLDRG